MEHKEEIENTEGIRNKLELIGKLNEVSSVRHMESFRDTITVFDFPKEEGDVFKLVNMLQLVRGIFSIEIIFSDEDNIIDDNDTVVVRW